MHNDGVWLTQRIHTAAAHTTHTHTHTHNARTRTTHARTRTHAHAHTQAYTKRLWWVQKFGTPLACMEAWVKICNGERIGMLHCRICCFLFICMGANSCIQSHAVTPFTGFCTKPRCTFLYRICTKPCRASFYRVCTHEPRFTGFALMHAEHPCLKFARSRAVNPFIGFAQSHA